VVQEAHPQHLRHREDPLGMAHILLHVVLEECRKFRRALGST